MTATPLGRKACTECACRPHCLPGRQDKAVRAAWEPYIRERRFARGEVLQRQGEALACIQVVKVGTVQLQRSADDGVERPIGLAGCGQTLGTSALLEQPADLSCVAVLPGRVCEIDVAPLVRAGLLKGDALLGLAHEQLRAYSLLADWAQLLRIRGATGRLAGALLLLADVQRSTLVRLPSHAVLAALLATTRETVARSIALLARQQGVLRRDRWHCEIVRDRLEALAQGLPGTRATLPSPAEPEESMPHTAAAPSPFVPRVLPLAQRSKPATVQRRAAAVRVA